MNARFLMDLGALVALIVLALTLAGQYQIAIIVALVLFAIGFLMSYIPR